MAHKTIPGSSDIPGRSRLTPAITHPHITSILKFLRIAFLLRKVQPTKVAMKFLSLIVICTGSFFGTGEAAKVVSLIVYGNVCVPFIPILIEPDAFVARSIIGTETLVASILSFRAFAKISSAIIQTVSIYMVYLFALRALKYLAVHKDTCIAPDSSVCISKEGLGRTPIQLRKPFVVSGIHNGIQSLRKRNQAVGWIERLLNCVTFHAVFHGPTSNGIMTATAILA